MTDAMTILVCPLSRVFEMVERHKPRRVISLLDPDYTFPDLGPAYAGRHLQLRFHDVDVANELEIGPSVQHVDRLLGFLRSCKAADVLLIHCRAGISRSTAAAFIAACFLNPTVPERDLAIALRRASPLARPNQALVGLADSAMSRGGRMKDAIASTGRDLPWIPADEGDVFEMPCSS